MSTSTNTGIMDGIVAPPSLVLPTLGASAPNSRLPTPPPVKRRNAHSVPVSPKGTKKKPLSPIASKAPLSPIVKSLYEHHKKRSPRANKKLAPCPVHSLSSMSQATLPNRFDREKCYEGKESLATMRGQFAGLMYDVRPPPIKGTPLFGSGPSSSIPAAPLGSLASPAFGGFGAGGFGAAPVPVSPLTIPPSTPEGDEDDDEEKRPPSPSFKEKERTDDDTEECLMRCKVKFFTKKDPTDPWGDHGVNHMELLREKVASDGKTRKVRIICRNSIGKAVLNAGLYKGMSVVVTEKKKPDGSQVKNGVIANLFNAAEEMVKKTTMFRLGKPEDVEKLHKYYFHQSWADRKSVV